MTNSIGAAVFFQMSGPLNPAGEQVEYESRSGVDGHAIWQTGSRGEPVEVQTVIDVVGTLTTAQSLLATYRAMRGSTVAVVRAGNSIGNFVVLDVQGVRDELLVRAVGGVNGGTVLLFARWSLLPVP